MWDDGLETPAVYQYSEKWLLLQIGFWWSDNWSLLHDIGLFFFFFFRLVIHGWRIWTKDALPSNSGFAWHGLSKWTWEQVLGKTHLFVVIFSIYSWFLSFEILSVMGRWCTPNLRDNYSYEIPAIEYLPKQIGEWLFHPRNEIETHHPCGFCCI